MVGRGTNTKQKKDILSEINREEWEVVGYIFDSGKTGTVENGLS